MDKHQGFVVSKESSFSNLHYEGKFLDWFKNNKRIEIFGDFAFVESKLRFFKTEVVDYKRYFRLCYLPRWKFDDRNQCDLFRLAQIMYNREMHTLLKDFSLCASNLSQEILSYDPLSEDGSQKWRFSKTYRTVIELLQNMTAENDLYLHRVPKDVINYKILPFLPELDIFLTDEARMLVEAEKLLELREMTQQEREEYDIDYSCLFDESKPIKLHLTLIKIRRLVPIDNLRMTEFGRQTVMEWTLKDDLVKSFRYLLNLGHVADTYVLHEVQKEVLRFCLYLRDNARPGHFDMNPILECLDTMLTKYEERKTKPKELCNLLVSLLLQSDVENDTQRKKRWGIFLRTCDVFGTFQLRDDTFRNSCKKAESLICGDENRKGMEVSDILKILKYISISNFERNASIFTNRMVVELTHEVLRSYSEDPNTIICLSSYLDEFLGDVLMKIIQFDISVSSSFEFLNTTMDLCLKLLNSDEIKNSDNYDEVSKAVEKTRDCVTKIILFAGKRKTTPELTVNFHFKSMEFLRSTYLMLKLHKSAEDRRTLIKELDGNMLLLFPGYYKRGDLKDVCGAGNCYFGENWNLVFRLFSIVLLDGIYELPLERQLKLLTAMTKKVKCFVGYFEKDEIDTLGDYSAVSAWTECFRCHQDLIRNINRMWKKSSTCKSAVIKSGVLVELQAAKKKLSSVYWIYLHSDWSGAQNLSNEKKITRFCAMYLKVLDMGREKKLARKDMNLKLKFLTSFLNRFFCLMEERQEKVELQVFENLTFSLLVTVSRGFQDVSVRDFFDRYQERVSFNEDSMVMIQRICDSPSFFEISLISSLHTKIPASSCPALLSSLFSSVREGQEADIGVEEELDTQFGLLSLIWELLKKVPEEGGDYESVLKDFLSHEYNDQILISRRMKSVIKEIMKIDRKFNEIDHEEESPGTTQLLLLWKKFLDVNFFSSVTRFGKSKLSILSLILENTTSTRLIEYFLSKTHFFTRLINIIVQKEDDGGEECYSEVDNTTIDQLIALFSCCISKIENNNNNSDNNMDFSKNLMKDSLKNIKFPTSPRDIWRYHNFVVFLVDEHFKKKEVSMEQQQHPEEEEESMKKIIYEVYGGYGRIKNHSVIYYYLEMEKKCPEEDYFKEEFLKSEYIIKSFEDHNFSDDDYNNHYRKSFNFHGSWTTTSTTAADESPSLFGNHFNFGASGTQYTPNDNTLPDFFGACPSFKCPTTQSTTTTTNTNEFTFSFDSGINVEGGNEDDDDEDKKGSLVEFWKNVF